MVNNVSTYSERRGLHVRYFLTFELGPDGAVDEEVDGGVDGEGEMVGAGQAQVPGGPHQPLAAPGTWFRVKRYF